ncbi:MAG: amidinotransferase [Deltaproteobacteria bacterium]|nr:amidinotransferase [Deltaproteobacteria bacterium]
MIKHALVCPPVEDLSGCVVSEDRGAADYETALAQHASYCRALEARGVKVIALHADPSLPDATFIDDTAVLAERCAVLSRPGDESRREEIVNVRQALKRYFADVVAIEAPGTLDGGDVVHAGEHFYVGLTSRTNESGAGQIQAILAHAGYAVSLVDIRGLPGALHLKSVVAYIGDNRLVTVEELAPHPAFGSLEKIVVAPEEAYAANCLRVNDRVLVASGFPRLVASLQAHGYQVECLDLSEFAKLEGGVSCLSLCF